MGFRGFVRFRGFQACLCFFLLCRGTFFWSLRVLFFLVVARDFSCRGVGFFLVVVTARPPRNGAGCMV